MNKNKKIITKDKLLSKEKIGEDDIVFGIEFEMTPIGAYIFKELGSYILNNINPCDFYCSAISKEEKGKEK